MHGKKSISWYICVYASLVVSVCAQVCVLCVRFFFMFEHKYIYNVAEQKLRQYTLLAFHSSSFQSLLGGEKMKSLGMFISE